MVSRSTSHLIWHFQNLVLLHLGWYMINLDSNLPFQKVTSTLLKSRPTSPRSRNLIGSNLPSMLVKEWKHFWMNVTSKCRLWRLRPVGRSQLSTLSMSSRTVHELIISSLIFCVVHSFSWTFSRIQCLNKINNLLANRKLSLISTWNKRNELQPVPL